MFVPVKSNTGAMLPWEYLGAAEGTYHAGQMLTVKDGKLAALEAASTTTPPYLCMADVKAADGQVIPVTRVGEDYIYETQLKAQYAEAKAGVKMQVDADGLTVSQGAGNFELVAVDGTQQGSRVCGRFTVPAAAAGP